MTTRLKRLVLALLPALSLLLAAPPARAAPVEQAPPERRELGFLLRMNLDAGGDKLVDVQWSDGSKGSIKAGQLITFSLGALYHPAAPWALEATVGYKFDKLNGSNGTIEFTRIPVDLIVSFASGRHRIGGGPTVHLSPTFNCSATGVCGTKVSFDTAVGGIVQYAYGLPMGLNGGLDFGLRATLIHYSATGLPTLDGTGFGCFFGAWL